MTDVIGRGVIQVSADNTQLKAGIEDAKRSVRGLGRDLGTSVQQGSARAQRSIEQYVKKVEFSTSVLGKSSREVKLLELAERGATATQLRRADAALRTAEAFKKQQVAARSATTASAALVRSFSGFAAVGVAGTIALATTAAIRGADTYAQLSARLKLVTSDTRDFERAQAGLFKIAQDTGSGLESTTDLFTKLSRATRELGVSQQDVLGVTNTINQALVVSGGSADSAAKALVQLSQGFASGVLRGEELNSVLEQAPRLAEAIADGLGVPIGKLRELGKEGELTAEKVFKALQTSAQGVANEFQSIPLTVSRASTQASNALLKLIGTMDEATDSSRGLADAISGAAGFIGELADEIKAASQGAANVGLLAESFVTAAEAVRVFASDVVFVFKVIGLEIGAHYARIAALATLDIQGFFAISRAVKEDTARARQELDDFQRLVLTRVKVNPDDQSNAEARRLGLRGPTQVRATGGGSGGKPKKERDPFGDAVKSLREQIALIGKVTELEKISEQISLGKYGKLNTAQASLLKSLAAEKDLREDLQAQQDAQLGLDLSKLQRDLDGLTSAYGASESILEAQRDAALIDEQAYYEAKRAFIRLNTEAEVGRLTAENARLSQEKKTGEERIRNQEKIAENEARIAIISAQGAASAEILGIQQRRAADQIRIGFEEAEAAAQSYLDSIKRGQQIELSGLGLGNRERDRQRGRAQIEDRYEDQRQRLESQRRAGEITEQQYAQELDRIRRFQTEALSSYDAYYSALEAKQQDFSVGATEALNNYLDNARDIAGQTEQLFDNAFKGMEDALVEFVTTGRLDFKSLADSIVADITRIIIKQALIKPFEDLLGGMSSGSGAGGAIGSFFSTLFGGGRAIGGPVSANRLYRVNEAGPEMLEAGGKQYLLTGSKPGDVKPATAQSQAQPLVVHNNFTVSGQTDRRTQEQIAAFAGRGVMRATARGTA
jgi:lambda family phage tail tape measure protein